MAMAALAGAAARASSMPRLGGMAEAPSVANALCLDAGNGRTARARANSLRGMACPRTATQDAALRGPFKFEMLVHVLCIFMLLLALALVLVLVLVRVDAGTGRLKSCYSNAQPSRLPLQLCRGNNKAHSSWYFSNHCLAQVFGLRPILQ